MPVWLTPEVIVSVATLLTAIIGFAATYMRMSQLEKNTNSKMDTLLVLRGEASEAIGNLQGRADARRIDANTLETSKEITGELKGEIVETGKNPKEIKGEIIGKITPARKKKP